MRRGSIRRRADRQREVSPHLLRAEVLRLSLLRRVEFVHARSRYINFGICSIGNSSTPFALDTGNLCRRNRSPHHANRSCRVHGRRPASSVESANICSILRLDYLHTRSSLIMNWDQIEGKWMQVKGNAKQQFGKLTDDDLTVIAGKRDKLIGKLQERYGYSREEAQRHTDEWLQALPQAQTQGQGQQPPHQQHQQKEQHAGKR